MDAKARAVARERESVREEKQEKGRERERGTRSDTAKNGTNSMSTHTNDGRKTPRRAPPPPRRDSVFRGISAVESDSSADHVHFSLSCSSPLSSIHIYRGSRVRLSLSLSTRALFSWRGTSPSQTLNVKIISMTGVAAYIERSTTWNVMFSRVDLKSGNLFPKEIFGISLFFFIKAIFKAERNPRQKQFSR